MKWIAALVVAIVLLAAAVMAAYQTYLLGWWRMNYPSPERFPVQGIDVSHHQGRIDWPRVAANQRISFVYLKATEGGDHKDRLFQENWMALKDTRLARGAYHFFTFCRPGVDQARNLLDSLPNESGTLPVAIDLEFGGNCARRPSTDDMIKEVTDFVQVLQTRDGRDPVFYMTDEFYSAYMDGHDMRYPRHRKWVRNVFSEPQPSYCAEWLFWQYASHGMVDGITGSVDLNVLCDGGDLAELLGTVE